MYVKKRCGGGFLLCLNCALAESLFFHTNLRTQTLVNHCANKHKNKNVTANVLLYFFFYFFFGLPIWLLL